MTNWTELKRLAEESILEDSEHVVMLTMEIHPKTILALIAENERLQFLTDASEEIERQMQQNADIERIRADSYRDDSRQWSDRCLEAEKERDQLRAEVEALRKESAWIPSKNDYDRAIHHNPDAKAWADLFVETFPRLANKHDLMLGWFANAMMAMHDFLAKRDRDELDALRKDAERYRALREFHWNESKYAVVRNPKEQVKLGARCPFGNLLDEAIDEEIARTQP